MTWQSRRSEAAWVRQYLDWRLVWRSSRRMHDRSSRGSRRRTGWHQFDTTGHYTAQLFLQFGRKIGELVLEVGITPLGSRSYHARIDPHAPAVEPHRPQVHVELDPQHFVVHPHAQ